MSGMDDPREILREAGVECASEVEYAWMEGGDAATAILALARLVAKYKWMLEESLQLGSAVPFSPEAITMMMTDFERRWADLER